LIFEGLHFGLGFACRFGYLEIAELLLEDARCVLNNASINIAAIHGNTNVVEFLLQDDRIDPTIGECRVLVAACMFGHKSVVQLLLQDGRVFQYEEALVAATESGYSDIGELLKQKMLIAST
jgi:ankyrin repeat protein